MRARHRRGRRHDHGEAGDALSRRAVAGKGSIRHADLRLSGQRRVCDAEGRRGEWLAQRRRRDAGEPARLQARRRRRHSYLCCHRGGQAAEVGLITLLRHSTFARLMSGAALLCALLLAACGGDKSGIRVINASTAVYDVPSRPNGTAVKPIAQRDGRGPLILHGGGIFRQEIAADIIARAGPDPHLCLIDTADNGEGQIYRLFDGFRDVHLSVFNLQPSDTGRPDVVATLRACSGFFFGGGAPQRLSETFRPRGRDTPALAAIRERFEKHGAVVAGSSAGAMVVGPVTLCECGAHSSVLAVTRNELFKAPGFDLLNKPVLIDAHFFARGLLGRHMFALARDRIPVGVGIDEDTAVLVPGDGGPWMVLAGKSVAIVRMPGDARMDSLHYFGISILSPGDRFDPATNDIHVAAKHQRLAPDSIPIDWPPSREIKYTFSTTADTADYGDGATRANRVATTLNRLVSVDPL